MFYTKFTMISIIGMFLVAQSCTLDTNLLLKSNSLLPEASDIVKVGGHYYVVGDDTCAITKIAQDGSATLIPTQQCSKSDFEALFRLPGDTDDANPTLVICKEDDRNCSPWRNGEFLDNWALVDGGDDCHDDVKWGKNKGIEGAVGVQIAQGEIFMMALIEGTGSIITYRLDTERSRWVSQSCTSVPASFSDYSGMALRDSTLAVVSQSSRKLWVGEVTQLFGLTLSSGAVYDFPRNFEGVEGIFIENLDYTTGSMSGVICSDDQAGSGNYANAVHRFSLTCDASTTTMPESSTTRYSATQMPSLSPTPYSGQSTYYLSERAYCDIQSELITDESECAAAAASLGLSDLTVKSFSKATRPFGCFFRAEAKSNQLWLNTDTSAERDSEDDSRRSLCLRASSVSAAPSQSPTKPVSSSIAPSQSPTTPNPSKNPTRSPTTTTSAPTRSVASTKSPTSSLPTSSPTSSPEKKKDSSDSDDSDDDDRRRNRRILESNSSFVQTVVAIVLLCVLQF